MIKYVQKPPIIQAEQWFPGLKNKYIYSSPAELRLAGADLALHLELFLEMRANPDQIACYLTVNSSGRHIFEKIKIGQWIVVDRNGKVDVIDDKDFHDLYEEIKDEIGQKVYSSLGDCLKK